MYRVEFYSDTHKRWTEFSRHESRHEAVDNAFWLKRATDGVKIRVAKEDTVGE